MESGWVATASRTLHYQIFISEAPFDGMDPQSHGAEIEKTFFKKKGPKKESPKAQLATKEETEICKNVVVTILLRSAQTF